MNALATDCNWLSEEDANREILTLLKTWGIRNAIAESSEISNTGAVAEIGRIGILPERGFKADHSIHMLELPEYLKPIDEAIGKLPRDYRLFCNVWYVQKLKQKDAVIALQFSCARKVYDKEKTLLAMLRVFLNI